MATSLHTRQVLCLNQVGKIRRVLWNGRKWLVAPITSIVPGVLNGSKGALYYPPQEIQASTPAWNGVPITAYHPFDALGNAISASDDEAGKQHIGVIRNSVYQGKLKHEGWFDEELTKEVNKQIYQSLLTNQPIEMSTGLFTDNEPAEGTFNGKQFQYVARNYRPDHVAVLPTQVGACSIKDGCGVLINQQRRTMTQEEWDKLGQSLGVVDVAVANAKQPRHPLNQQFQGHTHVAARKGFEQLKDPKDAAAEPIGEPNKAGDDGRDMDDIASEEPEEAYDLGGEGQRHGPEIKVPDHLEKGVLANKKPTKNCDMSYRGTDNMDPHYATKNAAGASIMAEHPDAMAASMEAMGHSKDGNAKKAVKAHVAAAEAHEGAATEARKKGNQAAASDHDTAAALHRKAASAHEATMNQEVVADSQTTTNASDKPKQGDDMTPQRKQLLAVLTANCSCEREKVALNSLSDEVLTLLHANKDKIKTVTVNDGGPAAADGTNKKGGTVQAGGEEETDEGDYESEDDFTPKTKVNKAKGAFTGNRKSSVEEWLNTSKAPPEVRRAVINAFEIEQREQASLISRLVANVAQDRRQGMVKFLRGKDLTELRLMVEMMPTTNREEQADDTVIEPLGPLYLGAGGGPIESVRNQSTEISDELAPPTINWADDPERPWAKAMKPAK